MLKRLLLRITLLIVFGIVMFIAFFIYAINDPITPNSYKEKNKIYLSIRYHLLTSLCRNNYPIYYNYLNLPLIKLEISEADLKHFSEIYRTLNKSEGEIGYGDYSKNNDWRKGKLIYNKNIYDILVKCHGKNPTRHACGAYLSLNIKLKNGAKIYGTNHFRLIIYERIASIVDVLSYLADQFGVLMRKSILHRVKINNWPEHLYFFEYRFNDEYMNLLNKPNLIIPTTVIDNNKSMIYCNSSHNLELLSETLNKVTEKAKYSNNVKRIMIDKYNKLNTAIYSNNYTEINNFFDINYISSFEAARYIGGLDGHGANTHNFYIYYDTVTFLFYPCLDRDFFPKLLSAENFEYQINHYLVYDNRLCQLMDQNETIRQMTYKKIYDFILFKNGEMEFELQKVINFHEKLYYADYIKSVDGLTLIHNYPLYVVRNLETLKSYIEKSKPVISIKSKTPKELKIDISPNSMAALKFSKLILKNIKATLPYNMYFKLKVISSVNDSVIDPSVKQCKLSVNSKDVDISKLVLDYTFSDCLDKESKPVKRKYTLIFSFDNPVISNDDFTFLFQNTITKQEFKPVFYN